MNEDIVYSSIQTKGCGECTIDTDCCVFAEIIGALSSSLDPEWSVVCVGPTGSESCLFSLKVDCSDPRTELPFTWIRASDGDQQTYPAFRNNGICDNTCCLPPISFL